MRQSHPTEVFAKASAGCAPRSGFTLLEVLNSMVLGALILGAGLTSYIMIYRAWFGVDARVRADHDINLALNQMVYGVDDRFGLRTATIRTIKRTDSTAGWTLSYQTGGSAPQSNAFVYTRAASNLVFNPGARMVCRDVSLADVAILPRTLIVTLRVDRVSGKVHVRREIGTQIELRNQ